LLSCRLLPVATNSALILAVASCHKTCFHAGCCQFPQTMPSFRLLPVATNSALILAVASCHKSCPHNGCCQFPQILPSYRLFRVATNPALISAVTSCHNPLSFVVVSWSSKSFLFNLQDGIL
jgi:hypothetical protein